MRRLWFEIVRCRGDRYSWVLVGSADGRRRVLARSGRDFRSRKRVYKAISALQEEIGDAEVLDATCDVELPATSFDLSPFTTPLFVGADLRPRHGSTRSHRSGGARGGRERAEVELDVEKVEIEVDVVEEELAPGPSGGKRASVRKKAAS